MIDEKTGKPIVYLVTEMDEEDGRKLPMEEKYAIIERKLAGNDKLIEAAKVILRASHTKEWDEGWSWERVLEEKDDNGESIFYTLSMRGFFKDSGFKTAVNYKWFLWKLI